MTADKAKELFRYYMSHAWRAGGLSWQDCNDHEIDEIVDHLVHLLDSAIADAIHEHEYSSEHGRSRR